MKFLIQINARNHPLQDDTYKRKVFFDLKRRIIMHKFEEWVMLHFVDLIVALSLACIGLVVIGLVLS